MNTTVPTIWGRRLAALFVAALVTLASTVGCQKKCQPAGQKVKSLRETPWRLIDTNNKSQNYADLNRFTFLIFEFQVNFKGDVKKVRFNDQFDTPIFTFIYNVFPEDNTLIIKYSSPASGNDGTGQQTQSEPTEVGTTEYEYELSNRLILREKKRNYYYEFVPFQGVVDPDSTCVF